MTHSNASLAHGRSILLHCALQTRPWSMDAAICSTVRCKRVPRAWTQQSALLCVANASETHLPDTPNFLDSSRKYVLIYILEERFGLPRHSGLTLSQLSYRGRTRQEERRRTSPSDHSFVRYCQGTSEAETDEVEATTHLMHKALRWSR